MDCVGGKKGKRGMQLVGGGGWKMERGRGGSCGWRGINCVSGQEGRRKREWDTHSDGVMKVNELFQVMKVYQASWSG